MEKLQVSYGNETLKNAQILGQSAAQRLPIRKAYGAEVPKQKQGASIEAVEDFIAQYMSIAIQACNAKTAHSAYKDANNRLSGQCVPVSHLLFEKLQKRFDDDIFQMVIGEVTSIYTPDALEPEYSEGAPPRLALESHSSEMIVAGDPEAIVLESHDVRVRGLGMQAVTFAHVWVSWERPTEPLVGKIRVIDPTAGQIPGVYELWQLGVPQELRAKGLIYGQGRAYNDLLGFEEQLAIREPRVTDRINNFRDNYNRALRIRASQSY